PDRPGFGGRGGGVVDGVSRDLVASVSAEFGACDARGGAVSVAHVSSSATEGSMVSRTSGGRLRLRRGRWGRYALVAVVVAYLAWSLVPVVGAFLFSFNSGFSRSIWQGFSLRWWTGPASVFHQPIYTDAIRHSFVLAVLVVLISVPLGVSLSIFLS